MAIDPRIPLQAQQFDLGSLYATAFQLRQMKQQMQTQNALQTLFNQPGALDDKGNPTPNTLAKIMRVSPQTGIELSGKIAETREREAQTAHATSEAQASDLAAHAEALSSRLSIYDAELKDGHTDPAIATRDLMGAVKDYVDQQPWADDRKAQVWSRLSTMEPAQLRQVATQLSMTAAERQEQAKLGSELEPATMGGKPVLTDKAGNVYDANTRQKIEVTAPIEKEATVFEPAKASMEGWEVVTDKDGTQYRYNPRTTEATTLTGKPYTPKGAATKVGTGGGAPKMYQNGAGDIISYKGGQWTNETKHEPLEGPPDDLHTVTSGSARSAPAMALQVYMKSPSYQRLTDEEKPQAIAEFNAGFHNVQIGGTAAAKADTSSLANITKIADASEAFEHTAMANFDNALKLAPKGIKTNMGPLIEGWIQDPAKALGDPNVPPYQAALLTAANEYAKVIAGSTGSQGSTVDSRREAAEMFSSLYNTDQIENVIGVAKQDMDNKIASYAGEREGIKARISSETGVGAGGKPAAAADGGAGGGGKTPHPLTPQLQSQMKQITDPTKRAEAVRRLKAAGYDTSGL